MTYILEAGVLRHTHHMSIWCGRAASVVATVSSIVVIIIIVPAALVGEVGRAFVLMRAAIVLEACYCFLNISRRVLVQLLVVSEDDDGDIDRAEDGELMRLLEQTALALQKGDRPGDVLEVEWERIEWRRGKRSTYCGRREWV